jgi:hypothetical protein
MMRDVAMLPCTGADETHNHNDVPTCSPRIAISMVHRRPHGNQRGEDLGSSTFPERHPYVVLAVFTLVSVVAILLALEEYVVINRWGFYDTDFPLKKPLHESAPGCLVTPIPWDLESLMRKPSVPTLRSCWTHATASFPATK